MNLIKEVDKPEVKNTIVVYSGRFQPFHRGHYASYQKLVSKFGKANVYIGTSNDTSGPKSPFNFKEKKKIATKMFGVPANMFVQIKNPYKPVEILKKFDGQTTQYVAAVGEKDADRLKGNYFKPYKDKAGYGYDEIGYVYATPMEANPISGTDVRNNLGGGDEEKAKKFFLNAYPKFDKEIYQLITSKLNKKGAVNEFGALGGAGAAGGFPGGIGVGLNLPNGYINGAPSGSANETLDAASDFAKYRYEPHPTRHEREHPANEPDWHKKNKPYDPISEIIDGYIFKEFCKDYFGEDIDILSEKDDETEAEKLGLTHLGFGLYGKGKDGPATHKKDDSGKLVVLPKPIQPGKSKDTDGAGKEKPAEKPEGPKPESDDKEPPAGKLGAQDFKSDAEKDHDEEKDKAKNKDGKKSFFDRVKEKNREIIDKIVKDKFNEEEEHEHHEVHDLESKTRKSWTERALDFAAGFPSNIIKGAYDVVKTKYHQYKNTLKGIGSLVASLSSFEKPKLGLVKHPIGGSGFVHYSDFQKKDKDGKPAFHNKPIYEKARKGEKADEHGHALDDNGNKIQSVNWWNKKPKFEKIPIPADDLNETDRKVFDESYKESKKQKKAIFKTIGEAATITASIITAGAIGGVVHGAGAAAGHAATTAATHAGGAAAHVASHPLTHKLAAKGLHMATKKTADTIVTKAASGISHHMATYAHHAAVDYAKHVGMEALLLGASVGHKHAEKGAAGGALLHGVGQSVGLLEEQDKKKEMHSQVAFLSNLISKMVKGMKDFQPSQELESKTIMSYLKKKEHFKKQNAVDDLKNMTKLNENYVSNTGMFNRKLSPQQKIDKLNPARAIEKSKIWHQTFAHHNDETGELNNDNIGESKIKSINHFVEYATERLKLKEKPKVTLLGGKEFGNTKSSLGGYNPESKEIFVSTEGRLTADILRTIAHEMVHRKQDEMGYITDSVKDGADGSKIENQANAVAGILMREYGRINKQIYNEAFTAKNHKAVSKADRDFIINHETDIGLPAELDTIDFDDRREKTPGYQFDTTDDESFGYEPVKEAVNRKNVHNINLVLNTISLKRFKSTPTFSNLLHRDQLKKLKTGDNELVVNNTVLGALERLQSPGNYKVEKIKEDINVNVNPGDTVLMGKFKNKKINVKDIGTDDHGMPTINGRQATTFRTLGEIIYSDKNNANIKKVLDTLKKKYKSLEAVNYDLVNKTYLFAFNNKSDADKMERDFKGLGSKKMKLVRSADYKNDKPPVFVRVFGIIDKDDSLNEMDSKDIHLKNIINKYKDRSFRKRINAYLFGNPNYNNHKNVAKELRNMDYREITQMEKDLNLHNPDLDEIIKKNDKSILAEGGAYGHMSHPFDDMDLTFGQLKDIIKRALTGRLGVVREKTDGQALAISWKNGRLIAARNKGHLANAGANAMGIEAVASKFGGRGGLTDAYNFAMKDLSAAIGGLSQKQKEKIFNEGKCFMNLEVIWPDSVNVIPYGQSLLIFHNTTCYDEKGEAVGADQGAARTLAGMIKQINGDVQSKYIIQGPPITEIPKNSNLSSLQGAYLSKLNGLQSEFKLSNNDTLAMYHQSWWEDFVNKSGVKLQKLEKEALIRRWAFNDKSFRLNTISDPEAQKWAMDNDKVNVQKQQKENMRPFEEIFLGVGSDVLEFVSSVLTVHPEKAIRSMKERMKSVANQVKGSGDVGKIEKLKKELQRLDNLGGIDKIVASEGLVFFYNGKTYKLTGTFAPLNQILGIFYEK